jgi:hypothetical protein
VLSQRHVASFGGVYSPIAWEHHEVVGTSVDAPKSKIQLPDVSTILQQETQSEQDLNADRDDREMTSRDDQTPSTNVAHWLASVLQMRWSLTL